MRDRSVTVRAHVDLIKFRKPFPEALTPDLAKVLLALAKSPRLKVPKRRTDDWLVLHDPRPEELRKLVNTYWWGELLGLEIAIDLLPKRPMALSDLDQVRGYLRHGLVPNQSPFFENARRYVIGARRRKPQRDLVSHPIPAGTIYWRNRKGYSELKLYRKILDQGVSVAKPWVRAEVAFNRGGCQDIDVRRIGRVPYFLVNARRIIGSAFTVARGCKFNPIATASRNPKRLADIEKANRRAQRTIARSFSAYGGTWCMQTNRSPAPDAIVGRAFGSAFQSLKRRFKHVDFDPKKRKQIQRFLADDIL